MYIFAYERNSYHNIISPDSKSFASSYVNLSELVTLPFTLWLPLHFAWLPTLPRRRNCFHLAPDLSFYSSSFLTKSFSSLLGCLHFRKFGYHRNNNNSNRKWNRNQVAWDRSADLHIRKKGWNYFIQNLFTFSKYEKEKDDFYSSDSRNCLSYKTN